MNWEAIGAVGEIVGALAVVLSLIYLAIQVRQNSNMARAESRLRLVATWREFSNGLKGKDPTAFGRGLQCYPELPVAEIGPFTEHLWDALHFFQCALALYESGTLDEEDYSQYESFIAAMFATPGGHRFWLEAKQLSHRSRAQALDARIARGQLPDIRKVFLMDSAGEKPTEGAQGGLS
jgi:hypothetical protein